MKDICEVYYYEIQLQCKNALIAYDGTMHFLNKLEINPDTGPINMKKHQEYMDFFWYSLISFLSATGNVSKLLWGSPNLKREKRIRIEKRTKHLRNSLSISENSILKDRKMRNNFEHFDERLDNWVMAPENKFFIDLNISSSSGIHDDEVKKMRNFDRSSLKLTCLDDEFDIEKILKEVIDVLQKVNKKTHNLANIR